MLPNQTAVCVEPSLMLTVTGGSLEDRRKLGDVLQTAWQRLPAGVRRRLADFWRASAARATFGVQIFMEDTVAGDAPFHVHTPWEAFVNTRVIVAADQPEVLEDMLAEMLERLSSE